MSIDEKSRFRRMAWTLSALGVGGLNAGCASERSGAGSSPPAVTAPAAPAPASALDFFDLLDRSEQVTFDQLGTSGMLLQGSTWDVASGGAGAAMRSGLLTEGDLHAGPVTVGDACRVIARVMRLPAGTDAEVRAAIQRFAQTGLLPQGSQPGFELHGADLVGMLGAARDEMAGGNG